MYIYVFEHFCLFIIPVIYRDFVDVSISRIVR